MEEKQRIEKNGGREETEVEAARDKYLAILEDQIVNPAMTQLRATQSSLQQELAKMENEETKAADHATVQRGLEKRLDKVDRTLRVVEFGMQRVKTMKLNEIERFVGAV